MCKRLRKPSVIRVFQPQRYWHLEPDNSLLWVLSYASMNVQQHPSPLPTRCQWYSPICDNKNLSSHCQILPGGQNCPTGEALGYIIYPLPIFSFPQRYFICTAYLKLVFLMLTPLIGLKQLSITDTGTRALNLVPEAWLLVSVLLAAWVIEHFWILVPSSF